MSEFMDKRAEKIRKYIETRVPFHQSLGLKVTDISIEDRSARLEMPFQEHMVGDTYRKVLHGGTLATLIDATSGAAVFTILKSGQDRTGTIDLRVDYLKPARAETVVAEGRVVRGGRTTVIDVLVFHPGEKDDPLALGRTVFTVKFS